MLEGDFSPCPRNRLTLSYPNHIPANPSIPSFLPSSSSHSFSTGLSIFVCRGCHGNVRRVGDLLRLLSFGGWLVSAPWRGLSAWQRGRVGSSCAVFVALPSGLCAGGVRAAAAQASEKSNGLGNLRKKRKDGARSRSLLFASKAAM